MKTCRNCKIEKPLSEFYTHPKMKDGHLNNCAACVKSRVNRHREQNIEKLRQYDRERGRSEERLVRNREYCRKMRNTEAYKATQERWKNRNIEKIRAQRKVAFAVRTGRIQRQPCEKCGSSRVEAHHPDYSQPLYVKWLCRTHHAEEHRRYA